MRDPQLHAGAPVLASVPFGRPPVLLRGERPLRHIVANDMVAATANRWPEVESFIEAYRGCP